MRAEELYNAANKGAGNKTPTVNEAYWLNDTTLVLTASGEDVLFVEFGTGIFDCAPECTFDLWTFAWYCSSGITHSLRNCLPLEHLEVKLLTFYIHRFLRK